MKGGPHLKRRQSRILSTSDTLKVSKRVVVKRCIEGRRCSKLYAFLCFLLVSCAAFLAACADEVPTIAKAKAITVLSYEKEDSPPQTRLAVFVQTDSDIKSCKSIILTSPNAQYSWKAEDLTVVEGMWTGYTAFVMPGDKAFPAGEYTVKYTDLLDHEAECTVQVSDGMEENSNSEGINNSGERRMAVYDEGGKLLYYGEVKSEWQGEDGEKDMWQSIDGAAMARECIVLNGGSVIRMMVPRYKNRG